GRRRSVAGGRSRRRPRGDLSKKRAEVSIPLFPQNICARRARCSSRNVERNAVSMSADFPARLRALLSKERLPAAIVDLDAFDRNFDRILRACGDLAPRIASKSVRVPVLLERVIEKGARGFMCFSLEEADKLSTGKMNDFLIAYPTLQRGALQLLAAMSAR